MKRFDIVVFGYTCYTVAGRNEDKLRKILSESAIILKDDDVNQTPFIIADVFKLESLDDMTKHANIILNCVGPFRLYGENVVKACIVNETHHLDISGEPQYLEQMQLKYHKEAQSKRVYIVGACGFDSIPAEFGIQYMSELFDGAINDIEYYLILSSENTMKFHYDTYESAVYGVTNMNELSDIRKKLLPMKLPDQKYSTDKKSLIFYSDIIKRWCIPLPEFDNAVVYRSQYYLHHEKGIKPLQFSNYLATPTLASAILTILIAVIFAVLCKFKCGRYLLLKFPSIFSFGMVSVKGGSRETIGKTKMEIIFVGKGWNSKSYIDLVKPNRKIISLMSGPDPAYLSCSIFIVQAAITILKEVSKMPENGGVYPPLAAFYYTSYIERIRNNGIQISKVSEHIIS